MVNLPFCNLALEAEEVYVIRISELVGTCRKGMTRRLWSTRLDSREWNICKQITEQHQPQ
jgi:hypothetical protein